MLIFQEVFSSFSVNDLENAKKFYEETLGLEVSENEMGLLELNLQETKVLIYPKQDHSPATFTVLNFRVKNLEETIDGLVDKGIDFEKYDGQVKTDSKGIHRNKNGLQVAWFKDPSENILSLIEEK
jgi:predicted enzyme related to lactoylglutathione lyase